MFADFSSVNTLTVAGFMLLVVQHLAAKVLNI